jgi:hypothetical protein
MAFVTVLRRLPVCALALIACTRQTKLELVPPPPQTSVKYSAHVAPGTPRYEEKEGEVSNRPVPVEHPPPEYPSAAVALGLHRVVVSVKVIVDSEGKVSEVRIPPAVDSAARPAVFDDAVRAALLRWRYVPLTFRRFAEVKDAEGDVVDAREVSVEHRPFSLDYDFLFELRDGKPMVGNAIRRE